MATWEDRLKKLRYRSPKGKSFTILYEDLTRSGGKRLAINEFPDQDLPYIEDLGESTVTFPISFYFYGDNYDTESDRFFKALGERGAGTLFHPRWGTVKVYPETKKQSESFIQNRGMSIVEVSFVRVSDNTNFLVQAISSVVELVSAVVNGVANFVEDIGGFITSTLDALSVGGIGELRATVTSAIATFRNTLSDVVRSATNLEDEFNSRLVDLDSNTDNSRIFSLVNQILVIPTSADTSLYIKVDAFSKTLDEMVFNFPNNPEKDSAYPVYQNQDSAFFALSIKCSVFVNLCLCVQQGFFNNRKDATTTFQIVDAYYKAIIEEIEKYEISFGIDFPYTTVENIHSVYNFAKRAFYFLGIQSKVENQIVLSEPSNIYPLAYQIYGDAYVDRMEELFLLNNLQDKEFFVIPQGNVFRYLE